MISLEQVRQLDIRVKKAVTAVKGLSAENADLKRRIAELEARLDELTREASDRQADEQRLEVSLQGVLDVLDEVDDETAAAVSGPEDAEEAFPVNGGSDELGDEPGEEPEDDVPEDGSEVEEADTEETPVESGEEPVAPDTDEPVPAEMGGGESGPAAEADGTESGAEPAFGEAEAPQIEETADLDGDPTEEVELGGDSDEEGDEDRFQSEFDIF